MIYYNLGILPVNIEELLLHLSGATRLGIGIVIAFNLIFSTASILFFGYFVEKIAQKWPRKQIFVATNLIWIIAFGLVSIAPNYFYFLTFYILASIGYGSFIPLGYSMISDYFAPEERGNKYGFMEFGLTIGNGMGIIFGGLLGTFGGAIGWRIAYGTGSLIGLLFLMRYIFSAVEPERGRVEPAFNGFIGDIQYNYKITRKDLASLFNKKTVTALLFANLFTGIAMSSLSNWAIYYLTFKINIMGAETFATILYIFAGIGAIPGTLLGGKLGDKQARSRKNRMRVVISMLGLIGGIFCFMGFYLLPLNMNTILEIVLSFSILTTFGFFGFFLSTLRLGNVQSIYSDVSLPETRSSAIALNAVMFNIGGIMGNLLLSSMIEIDLNFLSLSIFSLLMIWLMGSSLWIIVYAYYPKELRECYLILEKRRKEVEN